MAGSPGILNGSTISTAQIIEALGSSASVTVNGGAIDDSEFGNDDLIFASGKSARIVPENGATISGDSLVTSGGAAIEAVGAAVLSNFTISAHTLIETDAPTLSVDDGIIGSGAVIEALSSTGTGGFADLVILSGSISNGGTLYASGVSGYVVIDGPGISGGIAEVGDGVIEITGSSSETVVFQAGGSGHFDPGDALGFPQGYTGTVSGFGQNTHQAIALPAYGSVTSDYTLNFSGGVLSVSSGSIGIADIHLAGSYNKADFVLSFTSTLPEFPTGALEIFDPPVSTPQSGTVVNGGSIVRGGAQALPSGGIDLADVAFGAQTTLAYSENTMGGGILTVGDGRHAAAIALLGNYMAGSFVTAADGHGGTLASATQQTQQPLLLTHPPHG